MQRNIFIMAILLTFLICTTSWGQSPKLQAEKFLSTLNEGKIDNAYDNIFSGTGIVAAKPQGVYTVKAQTKSAFSIYGKAFAYEIIHDEKLSPSLHRLVYLQKFPGYPVTWELYFYKAVDKWVLCKISFFDQFQNISPMK